jgi:hypothetical protein
MARRVHLDSGATGNNTPKYVLHFVEEDKCEETVVHVMVDCPKLREAR